MYGVLESSSIIFLKPLYNTTITSIWAKEYISIESIKLKNATITANTVKFEYITRDIKETFK